MTNETRRRILWGAGLPASTLPDRIAAAARAGFTDLSVSSADQTWAREAGVSPDEMRRQAADTGLSLGAADGVIDWYPHPPPRRPLGPPVAVDDVLEAAAGFGATSVNAIAPYPTDVPMEAMAEHFAVLCDRAAEHDLLVHFEFTPLSPIDDVVGANKLVGLADRPNGGILFDTWHFCQVNPDLDALAKLDGTRIFAVQVSDGNDTFVEGLLADTFRHRLLPGLGTFPLVEVLRTLDAIGGLTLVGPEVLAVEQSALSIDEAAAQQGEAHDRVMAAAGLTD